MLDDFFSVIIGDFLQSKKSRSYWTCAAISLIVGGLFFLVAFVQEFLFSAQPMTTKDIIFLVGLSSVLSLVVLLILIFILNPQVRAKINR